MVMKGGRPKNPTGRKQTSKGHIIIRLESGEWVPEHRVVVERLIGRPLTKDEQVRHVNEDKTDNTPNNLEVWAYQRVVWFDSNDNPWYDGLEYG